MQHHQINNIAKNQWQHNMENKSIHEQQQQQAERGDD